MNSDTQQPLWQRVLPGQCLGLVIQIGLIVDFTPLPDQQPLHFTALNRQSGKTLWQADAMMSGLSFSSATMIVESQPFNDPTTPASITAIDMTSGKQLWSHTLKGANISALAFSPHAGLGATLLNTNGTSSLLALDERSGDMLWTLPTLARADDPRTWLADNDMTTLYFADSSQLRAIDLLTGTIRWQIAGLAGVPTSIEIQGQTLYETDGTQLIARDGQTGKVRWQRSITPLTQLCASCDASNGS
jgi:outer membrane protein assembly factor BamB